MAIDPLTQVLTLVAEGRLSADEAAPILAALDASGAGASARGAGATSATGPGGAAGGAGGAATGPDTSSSGAPFAFGAPTEPGTATALRVEVRDGGRQVVNLRLPLTIGRFALDRVPGLTGEAADRVRDALRVGLKGPVLEVDEGDGDGVRIVLE
jgi:hypothetical protein